jgi:PAS domain S-box-containing protein
LIIDRGPSAVIWLDCDGIVTEWGEDAERLVGIGREQAVGRLLIELLVPGSSRAAHADAIRGLLVVDRGRIAKRLAQITASRADGSEFPLEIAVTAVMDGAQRAFAAFLSDLSGAADATGEQDRLLSELQRELISSERRFDAVVGELADPVTIRDRTHTLIYANRAALDYLGLSSLEELRHTRPEAIMTDYAVFDEHGSEISMRDIPSVQLLSGGVAAPLLIRTVHRGTGAQRWNLLKASPLLDEAGHVEATIMVIEDVTEQQRAERDAEFLAHVADVLASSLDYEQTLRNVAQLAVPGIVDWCAVDLFDERGNRRPVVVAHADPERLQLAKELRRYEPEELNSERGIGLVLRTGEPLLYPEITDQMLAASATDERHLELLRAVGFHSALIVPITVGLRTVGAMTMVSADSGRLLDQADLDLAVQVAARASVAIENARHYSERSAIAHTLQQSLLPEQLPEISGYELAALYAPGLDGTEVGGDFYDVWPLDEGWMFTIGDVTGKGTQAAAMTSLVRHTMRAVSEFISSPAALLAHVDRTLKRQRTRSICTALCIRLHEGIATLAIGGHPLPILMSARGISMAGEHGPLLGGFQNAHWHDTTLKLEPGAVLLAYTDGVTDAIGTDGSRYGMGRLLDTLADCSQRTAGGVIELLTDALARFQTGPHADDTAIVALRRVPAQSTQPTGEAQGSRMQVIAGRG